MKKIILFSATAILLFAFSSCEKCEVDCDLVPVKIIRYDCDRVIFQILDSNAVGDAVWEDVQTGQRYNNVVSFYNTCKIASLTNGEMRTLYVSITSPASNQQLPDCYHCEALSQSPPLTKVNFNLISKFPCKDFPGK